MIRIIKDAAGAAKRLTALLLSIAMMASFAPTMASAQGIGSSNTNPTAIGYSGIQPIGLSEVDSYWPSFRGNNSNMAITNVPLPIDSAQTSLRWSKRLGSGWSAAPSNQIIVDNSIIVMGGQKIFKLDIKTGDILAQGNMVKSPGFAMTSPTYGAGMIFCALSNGTVQAFSAETLKSLWVYTDPLGGQSNSPITYSNGYIYTGFWNSEVGDATFVALPITDEDPAQPSEPKTAAWSRTNKGGFYWAGAVVVGDAVIFGSDDGVNNAYAGEGGPSKLYSCNRLTGEVISSLDTIGDQRSSIAYDRDSDKLYFTTKHGYLYSAMVDAVSGELSGLVERSLGSGLQSTSTPVVYRDRLYLGIGAGFASGRFAAADAETLELLYTLPLKGYPQCSLLMTTAYEDSTGYIYLYSTYNNNPGGITMIRVKPDATSAEEAELTELYDAAGLKNYCTSSLICGPDGTIYYKNDSSSILAVGKPTPAEVTRLIDLIGEVTAASTDAIAVARGSYNALPEDERLSVTNYALLTAAEAAMVRLEQQKKADSTAKVIGRIGTVTLDSGSKIAAARSSYDALTAEEKALVTNYPVLTAAESALVQLQHQQQADVVIKLIDDIGTVTKNSRTKIRTARTAYSALTAEQKPLVTNYSVLVAAENRYNRLISQGGSGRPSGNRPSAQPSPIIPPYLPTPAVTALVDRLSATLPTGSYTAAQVVELYRLYAQLTNLQKSEVLNYDVLKAQMTEVGRQNHTDATTGIRVDGVDWNIKLTAQPTGSSDAVYSLLADSIGSNTLLYAWDITLTDLLTNSGYTTGEAVTLHLPLPELGEYKNIAIAHYKDDGSVEYLDCAVVGDELVWQTSGFSHYAVVAMAGEAATPLPQTELPTAAEPSATPQQPAPAAPAAAQPARTLPWLWVVVGCLGIAALVVAILARRGKPSGGVEQ